MKLPVILFLSFMLYISIANAKQKTSNTSIQQLIQKVKSSTGDDRRVAMNTLKVRLRSMNQETRQHVMRDLQKSFSGTQHGMQKAVQRNTRQETIHTGNTGSMQQSGEMHTNPSQTPGYSTPTTVPHQPSSPQVPYQSAPSAPQQTPHIQPSSPQMTPPQQGPAPSMPSPHFGQPGGHK